MNIFDFIVHIDEHLANIITLFGGWTYFILFAIIFVETGVVIAPFLPGDSLLFAVGALAGGGLLNIWETYIIMLAAAIIGDTANYWIGHHMGPKIFAKENSRLFNREYLEKTREFYEKYGGKAVIIARFMPIIRTFAPFVAGIGNMHYNTFLLYNVTGGFLWVTSLTFAGYFFGGLSFIKDNFEYMVLGIIAISLLPMVIEYIKFKRGPQMPAEQLAYATYKDVEETFHKEHLND
jgi:membrane-associated protein